MAVGGVVAGGVEDFCGGAGLAPCVGQDINTHRYCTMHIHMHMYCIRLQIHNLRTLYIVHSHTSKAPKLAQSSPCMRSICILYVRVGKRCVRVGEHDVHGHTSVHTNPSSTPPFACTTAARHL